MATASELSSLAPAAAACDEAPGMAGVEAGAAGAVRVEMGSPG